MATHAAMPKSLDQDVRLAATLPRIATPTKAPTLLAKMREHSKEKPFEEPFDADSYSRQSTASTQCTWSSHGGTPLGGDGRTAWHSEASDAPQAAAPEEPEVADLCAALVARIKEGGTKQEREAATEAVRAAVSAGKPSAIEAVLVLVEDDSPWVRQAAVCALATAAEESRQAAVNAVLPRLRDTNPAVRNTAVQVLGQLSPDGRVRATVPAIMEKLSQEADSIMREALVAALVQVAPQGHRHAISTLADFASDCSCWVRLAAAVGLGRLAAVGAGEEVLAALCGCASDGSWQVREAAVEALGRIKWGRWKEAAFSSASVLQRDKSPRVREAAIAAVEAIAAQPGAVMHRPGGEAILEEPEPEEVAEGTPSTPAVRSCAQVRSGLLSSSPLARVSATVAAVAAAAALLTWSRRRA